jgi:hypothetical protein
MSSSWRRTTGVDRRPFAGPLVARCLRERVAVSLLRAESDAIARFGDHQSEPQDRLDSTRPDRASDSFRFRGHLTHPDSAADRGPPHAQNAAHEADSGQQTLDQEIEGSNPSSPAIYPTGSGPGNSPHHMWWFGAGRAWRGLQEGAPRCADVHLIRRIAKLGVRGSIGSRDPEVRVKPLLVDMCGPRSHVATAPLSGQVRAGDGDCR